MSLIPALRQIALEAHLPVIEYGKNENGVWWKSPCDKDENENRSITPQELSSSFREDMERLGGENLVVVDHLFQVIWSNNQPFIDGVKAEIKGSRWAAYYEDKNLIETALVRIEQIHREHERRQSSSLVSKICCIFPCPRGILHT